MKQSKEEILNNLLEQPFIKNKEKHYYFKLKINNIVKHDMKDNKYNRSLTNVGWKDTYDLKIFNKKKYNIVIDGQNLFNGFTNFKGCLIGWGENEENNTLGRYKYNILDTIQQEFQEGCIKKSNYFTSIIIKAIQERLNHYEFKENKKLQKKVLFMMPYNTSPYTTEHFIEYNLFILALKNKIFDPLNQHYHFDILVPFIRQAPELYNNIICKTLVDEEEERVKRKLIVKLKGGGKHSRCTTFRQASFKHENCEIDDKLLLLIKSKHIVTKDKELKNTFNNIRLNHELNNFYNTWGNIVPSFFISNHHS